ncbi:MAG: MTH1187 family thiamine-binding protein [Planctomycetota bacterium]
MKVAADLAIIPLGVGVSLSSFIAAAVKELEAAGLRCQVHAFGTNVEGDYDEVFRALKSCLETIHRMGAPRVNCTIKLGTRTDREQSLQDRVQSVEAKRGS